MTDITETETTTETPRQWVLPPSTPDRPVVSEEFAARLVEEARVEGVEVGPGGLLGDLTKRVLEAGLEAEMTDHGLRQARPGRP